jgi:hypothetical protein
MMLETYHVRLAVLFIVSSTVIRSLLCDSTHEGSSSHRVAESLGIPTFFISLRCLSILLKLKFRTVKIVVSQRTW